MGRVRIAVVGAGAWGRNIVRALKELESEGLVRVDAIVDADESRAKKIADEFNIATYFTDVLEVAARGISAAVVAVSIDQLTPVSRLLVERGVHVFVEKPVSLVSDDVLDLIRLARSTGAVVQPGFIVRFDPVAKVIKELLGVYGPAKYITFKRLSRRPEQRRKFPIVYDLMIHDIDLTQYFLGRKKWRVLSVNVIEFKDGATHTLEALVEYGQTLVTYIADGLLPVKIREVDVATEEVFIRGNFRDREVIIMSTEGRKRHEARGDEPLKEELRAFVKRIKGLEVSEAPTLEDAYEAVRVAEEIFKLETQ